MCSVINWEKNMGNSDVQLVGGPCGQHGPYTFYKAFKYNKNGIWRIVTLSEFFFVKMWRDSDLLCIGELQLLWIDKNSEQVLASLRLYFLPENTPEGRLDHGEDEVLAISEKVVIRVEDLITWITVEAEWTWGRLAKSQQDVKPVENESSEDNMPPRKPAGISFTIHDNGLDYADVENEKNSLENSTTSDDPHVVILSFPKYCRFRAMMKRLDGVEDVYLKYKIVNALGGFYVAHPNTRVLFCRDTFDYPELEGHELLCNHLAPKLKGRPRGKRKKRSLSPGSESNESESSVSTSIKAECRNSIELNSTGLPRRSTRCHENNENKEFIKKLGAFMKSNLTPIGRIPSLGYKELNLYEFFTRVQKLGGYEAVSTNRLWKSIFDEMSGHQNSTSAATVIRRHYERFLLPYERHVRGEEYKPLPASERRRLKYKRGSSSVSDPESSNDSTTVPSTSRKTSVPGLLTENKDNVKPEGKPSSLRSVRVKTDRQKDKQLQSEKESTSNNNNNNENWHSPVKAEDAGDFKSTVEKLVIKTESMTVKTELSTLISPTHPVKIEYESVNNENDDKKNTEIKYESKNIPVTISLKIETNLKTESSTVKEEAEGVVKVENAPVPVKNEQDSKEMKVEVVPVKSEPVTSAATPVAVKVPMSEVMSPVEGKENIPLIKPAEVVEPPYRPKPIETINVEVESYRNNFMHEMKKRKLDILKEGGLEVTPVRSAPSRDGRPSVIQPVHPAQSAPQSMPPPASAAPMKRTHVATPQAPTTPTKKSPTSFQFVNGATPPKVVQSRSIYSYSEKTVYGNPKDILSPMVHAPKFADAPPRQPTGGDPVDLSVNSPQKPVIEIMRMPQSSSTNRDSVTKNLYKTTPVMDNRRLGPNLEITLVGPNKTYPNAHKMYHQPSSSSSHSHAPAQKRYPADYYVPPKPTRADENGRYKPNGSQPQHRQMHPDAPKPASSRNYQQPNAKHPPAPAYPPYLTQLYEQAAKGVPYFPMIDPAMYYTAAMQNLYSNNNLNSAPVLPVPTAEQLKLYAELMAHGRLSYPYHSMQDNNKIKKP
ncbi:unnamed protein product [Phyllotreta striolata]|uniref:ARID domain-containing protein n=1 Tax=Phyllotreta striolata TaxID=444603 RepID=A0A9N9TER2_PHYSR|nr:unnamed protein product [Phyllotreta striolata]